MMPLRSAVLPTVLRKSHSYGAVVGCSASLLDRELPLAWLKDLLIAGDSLLSLYRMVGSLDIACCAHLWVLLAARRDANTRRTRREIGSRCARQRLMLAALDKH